MRRMLVWYVASAFATIAAAPVSAQQGKAQPSAQQPPVRVTIWNNPTREAVPGVEHKSFHSASMNCEVGYNIYLPPDYATSADKRYPVTYYLHGMGDDENTHLRCVLVLDKAVRNKEVPPMIYVYVNAGKTGWYTDSPDGKVMAETLIVKELIPHVDKTYRTIASREGRALQGFSMGGFGALKFAFKYTEMFSSTMAYSCGLIDADGMKTEGRAAEMMKRLFNGDQKMFDENTPFALLRKNVDKIRGKVAIRIAVGTKDNLRAGNEKMHNLLTELKIAHEYEEVEGIAHNPEQMYDRVGVKGFQFNAKAFGPEAGK